MHSRRSQGHGIGTRMLGEWDGLFHTPSIPDLGAQSYSLNMVKPEYSLRKEHEAYIQCVDHLASLYLQYRDYRETLRSLIASPHGVAILSSLGITISGKQSAAETDLAGISAQMETIESLIHNCHETTSSCAIPTTLYQLSPK